MTRLSGGAGLRLPRPMADFLLRVRTRGRSAAFRAGRMTGATVAAFLIAQLVGLHDPPPIIAALTALLVVQATLTSTLLNGVQRVASVMAGVALAVLVVTAVGLTWWSLAGLVAASIVAGQLLRLGPHLVEVPISAMLVLGVGAAGVESVGGGRVVETLIGAAVGVLVNLAFPPAVQTRYAGGAVYRFAGEIAGLLDDAAAALSAGPVTAEQSTRWLGTPGASTGTHPAWTGRWLMRRRAVASTCARWGPRRWARRCGRDSTRWSTPRCRCGPCSAPSMTPPGNGGE